MGLPSTIPGSSPQTYTQTYTSLFQRHNLDVDAHNGRIRWLEETFQGTARPAVDIKFYWQETNDFAVLEFVEYTPTNHRLELTVGANTDDHFKIWYSPDNVVKTPIVEFKQTVNLSYRTFTFNRGITIGNTATGGRVTKTALNNYLELYGGTSSFLVASQDGAGRVNQYWNASPGATNTYLVTGEPALRVRYNPTEAARVFSIYYAPAGTAGNNITWQELFRITSTGDLWIAGNILVPVVVGAAPPDKAVQFNQGGNLSGSANFLYDYTINKIISLVPYRYNTQGIILEAGTSGELFITNDSSPGNTFDRAAISYNWSNTGTRIINDGSARISLAPDPGPPAAGRIKIAVAPSGAAGSAITGETVWEFSGDYFFTAKQTARIGIGTTTPGAPLHIIKQSTAGVEPGIILRDTAAGNGQGLAIRFDSAASTDQARIALYTTGGGNQGKLIFYTRQATTQTRMVISETGNVGIGGNLNPSERLHVQGGHVRLENSLRNAAIGIADKNRLNIYYNATPGATNTYYRNEQAQWLKIDPTDVNEIFAIFHAPAGAAGSNITWNKVLSLSSSGDLWISGLFEDVCNCILTPQITNPPNGGTLHSDITASAYQTVPNFYGSHQSTVWQIASDPNFTTIVFNLTTSTYLTTLPTNVYGPSLVSGNTYYVRVRYRSDNHQSDWSPTVQFTFQNNAPVITNITFSQDQIGSPTIQVIDNYTQNAVLDPVKSLTYLVTVTATDPDGDPITYSVTSPDGATGLETAPNVFYFRANDFTQATPTNTIITITATVTDNFGASTSQSINRNVVDVRYGYSTSGYVATTILGGNATNRYSHQIMSAFSIGNILRTAFGKSWDLTNAPQFITQYRNTHHNPALITTDDGYILSDGHLFIKFNSDGSVNTANYLTYTGFTPLSDYVVDWSIDGINNKLYILVYQSLQQFVIYEVDIITPANSAAYVVNYNAITSYDFEPFGLTFYGLNSVYVLGYENVNNYPAMLILDLGALTGVAYEYDNPPNPPGTGAGSNGYLEFLKIVNVPGVGIRTLVGGSIEGTNLAGGTSRPFVGFLNTLDLSFDIIQRFQITSVGDGQGAVVDAFNFGNNRLFLLLQFTQTAAARAFDEDKLLLIEYDFTTNTILNEIYFNKTLTATNNPRNHAKFNYGGNFTEFWSFKKYGITIPSRFLDALPTGVLTANDITITPNPGLTSLANTTYPNISAPTNKGAPVITRYTATVGIPTTTTDTETATQSRIN